jgi:hypothetical protein
MNTSPRNSPIPLDASFVRIHGREQTENELKRIVCSVKFELLERASAFRLLGPEMSYHLVDPHLPEALKEFHPGMALAEKIHSSAAFLARRVSRASRWMVRGGLPMRL